MGAPDQPTRNQVDGKKKTHRLSPGVFTLPGTTPGAVRPLGPSGWSHVWHVSDPYLFSTGLSCVRSQTMPQGSVLNKTGAQERRESWGSRHALLMNNSFGQISVKSVLPLGHLPQGGCPDPRWTHQGLPHFPSHPGVLL